MIVKGIRQLALSLVPRIHQQEIVSNNLANLNSSGYKKDRLFTEVLRHAGDSLAQDDEGLAHGEIIRTDFTQGGLERTGAPLDIALNGPGFLLVQGATEELLTRGGSFFRNSAGQLVNAAGEALLGGGGAITIPASAGQLTIGADGSISADGTVLDQLRVVRVNAEETLQKAGGGRFRNLGGASAESPPKETEVRQGFLEGSNANGVQEMTRMMSLFRAYEASERAIEMQGKTVDTAIGRVGRVGG
jgi:flagellar basal body rod protein FlgG